MKNTENILLLCLVGIFVLSCSNNSPCNPQIEIDEAALCMRIDSLNKEYGISSHSIRHKPQEDAEEQKDTQEMKKEDKAKVIKADGAGFIDGSNCGSIIGTAIGIIATSGNPIGTAWGTVIGWATGGIIGATAASIIEAAEQEQGQLEYVDEEGWVTTITSEKDIYAIDLRNPIYSSLYSSCVFDDQIIGSNVGWVHNYIISLLFANNGSQIFFWDHQILMDSIMDIYFDMLVADNADVDVTTFGKEILYAINTKADSNDEYFNMYVSSYKTLSQEQSDPEILKNYTEEYMEIVQASISSECYALAINGSISTYFYSARLWHTYIPNVRSSIYICANKYSKDFYTLSGYDAFNGIVTGVLGDEFSFVGIPNIRDGKIESLFVFDELFPLHNVAFRNTENYISNNTFHLDEDIVFQNLEYYDLLTIPAGTYHFDRFEEGYVVFFE